LPWRIRKLRGLTVRFEAPSDGARDRSRHRARSRLAGDEIVCACGADIVGVTGPLSLVENGMSKLALRAGTALTKVIRMAKFDSARGAFTYNVNGMPIQNF
jgi:hypothetical protein